MAVRFYLNTRSDTGNESVSICLVAMRGGTQVKISTPVRARPSDWARKQQRVRSSVPGAAEVNGALARLKADAERMLLDCRTEAELRQALRERLGKGEANQESDILELFDRFIEHKRTRCSVSTINGYRAARGHLAAFLDDRTITPSAIGPSWLDDLATFLAGTGVQNSTVNKILTRTKSFLRWLVRREMLAKVPVSEPLPTAQNFTVYLSLDELAILAGLDLSEYRESYEATRDSFILGAVTGQRFSDVQALRWEDLVPPSEPHIWRLSVKKTGDTITVPLTAPARSILERRRGEPRPLPRLTNQKANIIIKELCKLAGIDEPVTTHRVKGSGRSSETRPKHEVISMHAAKRSFVTVTLQSGLAPHELLGFTHRDLKTLELYAGKDQGRLTTALGLAFDDLEVRAG